MDCSPPGSSVHVILQARVLQGITISSSKGKMGGKQYNSTELLWGLNELIIVKLLKQACA